MADLLTHYVSARLAGIRIRDHTTTVLFAVGVFLPDLIGKPLNYFLPYMAEIPSHTPFGLIFACGAVSLLFAESIRRRAFWTLYGGSLLHVLLDLMKDYLGSGSVFLLHPFSVESYELGFYRSEDVFYLLPANLAILAILWALGRRRAPSPPREDVTVP
ncbi:MAG TPA: hypothetical protein VJU16_01300 [Planctomycetota bacterium]|nr:hypothetical protein [Planctomycetota bacterium]